jgi:Spy/CpxP family protein refolding chaperone
MVLMVFPSRIETFPRSAHQENWAKHLQLSAEQVQVLRAIQRQYRQELVQINHKVMLKRIELKSLNQEEFMGENGEELRRQIQTLRIRARERSLVYQKEALAILTPEQQKKLPPDCTMGFYCREWMPRGGMGRGMGRSLPGPPSTQEGEPKP